MFERSLAMRRRHLGNEHLAVAHALRNLARLRRRLGKLASSEALLREALPIWRRLSPEGHPAVGTTARLLGEVLLAAGRPAEAEPLLVDAFETFVDHAVDHPERRAAEAALAKARDPAAAQD
jgi:hypothetical protein